MRVSEPGRDEWDDPAPLVGAPTLEPRPVEPAVQPGGLSVEAVIEPGVAGTAEPTITPAVAPLGAADPAVDALASPWRALGDVQGDHGGAPSYEVVRAGVRDEPPALDAPPPGSRPPVRRWQRRLATAGALAAIAVGSGVTGAVVAQRFDGVPKPPTRPSGAALDVGASRDGDLPAIDVAAVAELVAPSVVTISADVDDGASGSGSSIGTGIITTADGEILTNAHVVEGATAIRVRLAGETEPREATLLASDAGNDLALLRIAGDGYTPATFADPGSARIGDQVVAIGFALDLDGDPSVTLGIVSALDRTIITGNEDAIDGLIQTDAAISSGNSGGPLVDALGQVVGINTAVARGDATTAASNVGFAISVGEALPVIEALREQAGGEPRREGFLGVEIDDRRDGGQGAVISAVRPDTPAEAGGMRVGDVVIAVDGIPVDGAAGLVAAIRDRAPGDALELAALRNGEPVTLRVTLTSRPDAT